MTRGAYPLELRQEVLVRLAAGERVSDIARGEGISCQTIYNWRRQDLVDRGIEPGLSSPRRRQLQVVARRIQALEAELGRYRALHDRLRERPEPAR